VVQVEILNISAVIFRPCSWEPIKRPFSLNFVVS